MLFHYGLLWDTEYSFLCYTAKSLQLCPTLCDPIDGSPPGPPVPGILQARTLEWVAISFSNAWKWKVKVKSLSRIRLLATPWTAAYQAPPSMGFSRREYWSGVPLPSPPVLYSRTLLFNTIDREAWRAAVRGVAKSQTRLRDNWTDWYTIDIHLVQFFHYHKLPFPEHPLHISICTSLIKYFYFMLGGFPRSSVKNLHVMQEIQVWSLGWEDPLEKKMAPHSSTLAWKIPWTEEPGGLQSMGSQRVTHDWATSLSLYYFGAGPVRASQVGQW